MTGHAPNRWVALAVLFGARISMAVQFQSVAALSPLLSDSLGVGLADLGFLIGLYFLPGAVIAFPGGAIAQRIGDRRVVIAGMLAMLAGGLIAALLPSWPAQVGGRLLAGIGGVFLNVLMTKMVTDHFAGREIATAMGIFVNSWPLGIALTLVCLPLIGAGAGLGAALLTTTAVVAGGLVLFALGYRAPDHTRAAPPRAEPLGARVRNAVLWAGAAWGLYNGALSMVFSFGPTMLTQSGWSLPAASSTSSLVMWVMVASTPLSGVLADRTGRPSQILLVSSLVFAACLLTVPWAGILAGPGATLALFATMGVVAGLPPAILMSLPGAVLSPGNRARGMGLFFTVYYIAFVLCPILAGSLSQAAGGAWAAFVLGTALMLVTLGCWAAYRRQVRHLA